MLNKTACYSLVTLALIFSNSAMCGPTRKYNGGLEGTAVKVAREGQELVITISLRNAGKNTAYLMLIGPTLATDSSGASYRYENSGGINVCAWYGYRDQCIDDLSNNPSKFMPKLTQVDPETTIDIIFTLKSTLSKESHGGTVDFSTVLAARFVSDPLHDGSLRDDLKAKQVRTMSLNFHGEPAIEAR